MTSSEITTAATAASRGEISRATSAPSAMSTAASRTINCPGPKCGGSVILPNVPPIALARPPPRADVVSQGSQAHTDSARAHNDTSQPGRRRVMAED